MRRCRVLGVTLGNTIATLHDAPSVASDVAVGRTSHIGAQTRQRPNRGLLNRDSRAKGRRGKTRGSSVDLFQTKGRQNGRKHRHSLYFLSE